MSPDEARERIRQEQRRAEAVTGVVSQAKTDASRRRLLVRCGKDKCRRQLAHVYDVAGRMLFVSRLPWRPVDRLADPPWVRRALRLGLTRGQLDDDSMSGYVTSLFEPVTGQELSRMWIGGMPDAYVLDVLDLPDPEGVAPQLWVRCVDHPGSETQLPRPALADGFRRGGETYLPDLIPKSQPGC